MIKIDTSGLAAFLQDVKMQQLKLDLYITERFRKWTFRVFTQLVTDSPQWSSNLASNWNYSVNGPDYSYDEVPNKTGFSDRSWASNNQLVFERGHPDAVNAALSRAKAGEQPTWRDKVYFTNETPADSGGDLVDALESGAVKVRPVNLVQGQVALIAYTVQLESMRRGAP